MANVYTVYLSSTLKDLEAERDAVEEVLKGKYLVKQSYDASEDSLIESCRKDVANCQLYIGILGLRYGYIPSTDWNKDKLSITEIEYNCAVDAKVPCFMFMKSEDAIFSTMTDSHTKEHPEELIAKFRLRIGSGVEKRSTTFKNIENLKTQVLRALMDFEATRPREPALFQSRHVHARTLRPDIVVGCVRGTDDACVNAIRNLGDPRFGVVELSPNDPSYLATFDTALRGARVGCLLVTQASLIRLVEADKGEKVAAALKMLDDRTLRPEQRSAFLVLDGVAFADVPVSWSIGKAVELPAGSVANNTGQALDTLFSGVRAATTLDFSNIVIGLPYVVIALNRDEAVRMNAASGEVFNDFSDSMRQVRFKQYSDIGSVLSKDAGWPANCYGPRRDDWRPLGHTGPTVQELLESVVERINQSKPGSREQKLLRGAKLQLQRYTFDEFIDDRFGSRGNLITVRENGCLVLVDDLALLKPALRTSADELTGGSRAAILSISPLDPEIQPIGTLLDETSRLRVGTLIDRFRGAQDPRCELALHSRERIERWLRFVLPELIASTQDLEGQPELVANVETLFS
ncbi:MAG: DUF4062 domain-containing protein [Betaproteobacteria bacterium]